MSDLQLSLRPRVVDAGGRLIFGDSHYDRRLTPMFLRTQNRVEWAS